MAANSSLQSAHFVSEDCRGAYPARPRGSNTFITRLAARVILKAAVPAIGDGACSFQNEYER